MSEERVKCNECGQEGFDYLASHLIENHGLSVEAYQIRHPGNPVASQRLLEQFAQSRVNVHREHPPAPDDLTVTFAEVSFPVNPDVPASACLPMPEHYHIPRHKPRDGSQEHLAVKILHALVCLKYHRSMYVWGLPGSGKDALFHAWSAMTRQPAVIKSVKPGTDIESWFFSRAFNEKGTYWEDGAVLTALRDGYLTSTGRQVPYLFLVSDLDRADRSQTEHLRLILDSIKGRIDGPAGKTCEVLPGTIVVATGNTSGAGDERGRMISANPLDASVMERFHARFKFPWMDWGDEKEIVLAKFPFLFEHCPSALEKVHGVTQNLRDAILKGELYGEFSHRGLCSFLEHAQDILRFRFECGQGVPKDLLQLASCSWVDGLPDEENRLKAIKIMDPNIETLNEGDTSHISGSLLDPDFK